MSAALKHAIEAAKEVRTELGAMKRWTVKTLRGWLREEFGIVKSVQMLRRALHRLGWSFKKARKILAKASTEKRKKYLEKTLLPLLNESADGQRRLIFVDEAHVHQDADLGYGWAPIDQRLYAPTISPGLFSKKTFYGFFLLEKSQVHIWSADRANGETTVTMLEKLSAVELGPKPTLIWDGAPAHRSLKAREKADELGFEIVRLPGYSPDFMPVEELWKWLREDVTYNDCPLSLEQLVGRVAAFEKRICDQPELIAQRLQVRTRLKSEEEKLRLSK